MPEPTAASSSRARPRERGAGARRSARRVRARERIVGAAARVGDRDNAEQGEDRKPISDRPEQRGHEMPVAVHVRVGVRRSRAGQVEGVLPAEVEEDGLKHEDADDDAVADELVGDHGLDEEREQGESPVLAER